MMGSVDSPRKCFWNGHRSVLDAVVDMLISDSVDECGRPSDLGRLELLDSHSSRSFLDITVFTVYTQIIGRYSIWRQK